MLNENASRLKRRLKDFGFADPAIEAAWPEWWSEDADTSLSAKAELRFSLARKLGLEPRSLLEENDAPRFVWRDIARFKNLAGENELEKAALTSFGAALGHILIDATTNLASLSGVSALDLRKAILRNDKAFVDLRDLLSVCWSCGIPTVHLRVFPMQRKRMAAMTVETGERSAILLGKNASYPAPIAFYLAHEIGHIALGHLRSNEILVDLDRNEITESATDSEEAAADRYALELLTGEARPRVLSLDGTANARSLAEVAVASGPSLQIEPGTLALCFGYSTGAWPLANAAMRYVYDSPKDVWQEVNAIALRELSLDSLTDDMQSYLLAVLRGPQAG